MRKAVPSVITKIKARQIIDSRGIPMVEVDLYTNKGMFQASAPSDDATGMYEAVELRDGDKGTYLGNSVNRVVKNVNKKMFEALIGMDLTLQSQIDQAMINLDKTEKKGELGANVILAMSIAACKAGADLIICMTSFHSISFNMPIYSFLYIIYPAIDGLSL